MIDHKAALRTLAEQDGCKASLQAAAHIEYIERQLASSRDYSEHLRRKLERVRHQRNELRRKLTEVDRVADEALRTMREHQDVWTDVTPKGTPYENLK
jgi:chromosome segregation ATPase